MHILHVQAYSQTDTQLTTDTYRDTDHTYGLFLLPSLIRMGVHQWKVYTTHSPLTGSQIPIPMHVEQIYFPSKVVRNGF